MNQMFRKFPALVFCFFLLFSSFAQNKYEWKTASSAGYEYKYVSNDPLGARFYTLKNGLTVILSVNHAEPRIAVRIAVRTGSNNDPGNHTGLAHYLEHLLFKGTTKYGSLDWPAEKIYLDSIDNLYEQYNSTTDTAQRSAIYRHIDQTSNKASHYAIANEYVKLMTDIGSQETNAHTSVEETIYEEDIPSNATDKFLAVQAERFRDPVFRLFHTELEAVYEEKNRTLDDDNTKLYEAMNRYLFPTHNYGQQTTIGTIGDLKSPSLKAIKNYYQTYYVPNNIGVIMAGDFDPDAMIKKIDTAFSYMQQKPVQAYNPAPEKPMDSAIVKTVYGPSAESVRFGFRTAAAGTRDALVLDLISDILANGKAGLMDLDLNKQQKVQSSNCYLQQYKDYGTLVFTGAPKEGQSLDEVKDLLFQEAEKLKKGDFDESLVKAIVANSKLALLEGLKKNGSRVEYIADEFIKSSGASWNLAVRSLDEQAQVGKQEIMDIAGKYIGPGYVLLYKKKGEDKDIIKVDKPHISPIETNTGMQSLFVKEIETMPVTASVPQFLDYKTGFLRTKLAGADVAYLQNKENDLFHLYFRFDMGSWNNRYLSLAAQYIQFLSTPSHSAADITKAFYNIACSYSINVSSEVTTVSISGLSENMDKAITLFEELLKQCKPDEEALASLKERIAKSRSNALLNKTAIMQGLVSYARFGGQNPYNFVLSTAEINALRADTLTSILHRLESFRHMIIYYGPVEWNTLKPLLLKLHPLPAVFRNYPPKKAFIPVSQDKPLVLFNSYDMQQSEIYWIRNGGLYDASKEPVIDVFNNYFGGSMGSVVFQTIRESKALAYSTFAQVVVPAKKENPFLTVAYIGCQADKFKDAISGMNDLLKDLPLTEQNFALAKSSIKKDIETQRFTDDEIIFSWLAARSKGWDHDMRMDEYKQIDSISLNDIKTFHDNTMSGKAYTYCIVGSDKKLDATDLKHLGEFKALTSKEIFGF